MFIGRSNGCDKTQFVEFCFKVHIDKHWAIIWLALFVFNPVSLGVQPNAISDKSCDSLSNHLVKKMHEN